MVLKGKITKAVALSGGLTGGGDIAVSGTKQITENGTHDVSSYAFAKVQVTEGENGIVDVSIEEVT